MRKRIVRAGFEVIAPQFPLYCPPQCVLIIWSLVGGLLGPWYRYCCEVTQSSACSLFCKQEAKSKKRSSGVVCKRLKKPFVKSPVACIQNQKREKRLMCNGSILGIPFVANHLLNHSVDVPSVRAREGGEEGPCRREEGRVRACVHLHVSNFYCRDRVYVHYEATIHTQQQKQVKLQTCRAISQAKIIIAHLHIRVKLKANTWF
jgi:hypothetical protein